MLERRELRREDDGSSPTTRESIDTLRSCAWKWWGYENLIKHCQLLKCLICCIPERTLLAGDQPSLVSMAVLAGLLAHSDEVVVGYQVTVVLRSVRQAAVKAVRRPRMRSDAATRGAMRDADALLLAKVRVCSMLVSGMRRRRGQRFERATFVS